MRILFFLMMVALIAECAYFAGQSSVRSERECVCGQTRSCAFAAGLVGVQQCRYDLRWDRCEPDPRYKAGGL